MRQDAAGQVRNNSAKRPVAGVASAGGFFRRPICERKESKIDASGIPCIGFMVTLAAAQRAQHRAQPETNQRITAECSLAASKAAPARNPPSASYSRFRI
jgi:hypothetical protein